MEQPVSDRVYTLRDLEDLLVRKSEALAALESVNRDIEDCKKYFKSNPPEFKRGCLGDSPFDWFVRCSYHGASRSKTWCPSCETADDVNSEVRKRLEDLKSTVSRVLNTPEDLN